METTKRESTSYNLRLFDIKSSLIELSKEIQATQRAVALVRKDVTLLKDTMFEFVNERKKSKPYIERGYRS